MYLQGTSHTYQTPTNQSQSNRNQRCTTSMTPPKLPLTLSHRYQQNSFYKWSQLQQTTKIQDRTESIGWDQWRH